VCFMTLQVYQWRCKQGRSHNQTTARHIIHTTFTTPTTPFQPFKGPSAVYTFARKPPATPARRPGRWSTPLNPPIAGERQQEPRETAVRVRSVSQRAVALSPFARGRWVWPLQTAKGGSRLSPEAHWTRLHTVASLITLSPVCVCVCDGVYDGVRVCVCVCVCGQPANQSSISRQRSFYPFD
jgi:hypothetical protein